MTTMTKSKDTMLTFSRDALIVRIPWDKLADCLKIRATKSYISEEDILHIVEEGRKAYKLGKTRVIRSLAELQS